MRDVDLRFFAEKIELVAILSRTYAFPGLAGDLRHETDEDY